MLTIFSAHEAFILFISKEDVINSSCSRNIAYITWAKPTRISEKDTYTNNNICILYSIGNYVYIVAVNVHKHTQTKRTQKYVEEAKQKKKMHLFIRTKSSSLKNTDDLGNLQRKRQLWLTVPYWRLSHFSSKTYFLTKR